MHKSVLEGNIASMRKQRNLFLMLTIALCFSTLLVSFKLAVTDEKVVLVPGLRSEMMVSKNGISASYLEEFSLLFLNHLLDLSPETIAHKKDLVLKYTTHHNKAAMAKIVDYFGKAELSYKKFGLTTYFTVKNLELNMEELEVVAHGLLTSYYGRKGHISEDEDYKLSFEFQGGQLRLKSFVRLMTESRKQKDLAWQQKLEKATGISSDQNILENKEESENTDEGEPE